MPRFAAALSSLALLLTLAIGASVAAQDGTPVATRLAGGDRVLRIHQGVSPSTLDPQMISFVGEIGVAALDFEGLTRLAGDLGTVPAAAESWEFSEGQLTLTFTLREGLTYADGSPLTAEDFRYAIERTCDPRTAAPYAVILFDVVGCEALNASLGNGETAGATPTADAEAAHRDALAALGARALDDRTLEIRLAQPAAYFPTIASTWVLFPSPRAAVEANPEGWWRDPAARVGNGPFRLARFEEGDQARIGFVPNERYWAGRPNLDGIEFVVYPDSADALAAFNRGELDIAFPSAASAATVQDDANLAAALTRYPSAGTLMLSFNLDQEPFGDPAVREAFALAFDRESYCREIEHGACVPALSWIPPDVPGRIETDAWAFDPEAARQALAASSYGGPEALPPVTYTYPDLDQAAAEWIAAGYRDVLGVEIVLAPVTADGYFGGLLADPATRPQLALDGWFQDYPDPQNWLTLNWTCDSTLYATVVGYCNPAFDDLVARADREPDPVTRIALYEEAGRLLVADAPAVFFSHPANVAVIAPRVVGYDVTSADPWPGWTSVLTIDIAAP